jgi:hypothetical protein
MPEKIVYTLNVQVTGGPKLLASNITLEVDAYDKILVNIEKSSADKTVDLQPSSTAGQVQFLMITATDYKLLSYKVNDDTGDSFELDAPHLLIGKGAIKMLDAAPTKLLFSNSSSTQDAAIEILVGRDATP